MIQFTIARSAARVLAVVALAAVLAACGRGKEEVAADVQPAPAADGVQGDVAAPPPVVENPDDQRMANAVVTGKTAAAVDLKYDVLAKPAVGQPFEVELALLPRVAADSLEVGGDRRAGADDRQRRGAQV